MTYYTTIEIEITTIFISHKQQSPHMEGFVVLINSLRMTYFRMRRAYYHWRWIVSRPCSRWEGVVPNRYCPQA